MATSVGTIRVDATLDKSKFDQGAKDIEKTGNSTANKLVQAFKDAGGKIGEALSGAAKSAAKAATVAITGATTAMAGMAVSTYADYEQLTGGIDKLFGDASLTVQKNADRAYQTAGLSANQYMEAVTGFSASLISGLGGNTAEAAKIADLAMQDMSDNANTFGTDMDSIMYTYQGFAKQNYTMLDNLKLGYGGTASEMARLINDSGVLGDTMKVTAENVNEVSFDKIIQAIHTVQENMNIAGTTSREAATTISGSMNSMKASWSNLMSAVGVGDGIDTAMEQFTDMATTVMDNTVPILKNAVYEISTVLPTLLPQLVTALSNLFVQLVPQIGILIQNLAAQLPTMMRTLVSAITNPVVIQSILDAGLALLMALISTLTDPTIMSSLVEGAIQLFMGIIEAIPTIVDALINAMPMIINVLTSPDVVEAMLTAAVQLFLAMVAAVPQILGALIDAFHQLVSNLWNGIIQFFTNIGENIGNAVVGALKGIVNGALGLLEDFLNAPIRLINGALDLINALPGVEVGHISEIELPRMATGGYVGGYGTSTSDSNPAMLSRGEYVVKADTVRMLGVDFMDNLNEGKLPVGGGSNIQNYYYQFDQRANNRWMYQQIKTGAAA